VIELLRSIRLRGKAALAQLLLIVTCSWKELPLTVYSKALFQLGELVKPNGSAHADKQRQVAASRRVLRAIGLGRYVL
jgi:hypothetical protein